MASSFLISRVKFFEPVAEIAERMIAQAEERARELAPVGESHPSAGRSHGTLKNSVHSRITLRSSLRIHGYIKADGIRAGNDRSHARWVHEGRGAIGPKSMRIPFKDAVVWVTQVRASTPKPFLRDAAVEVFGRRNLR